MLEKFLKLLLTLGRHWSSFTGSIIQRQPIAEALISRRTQKCAFRAPFYRLNACGIHSRTIRTIPKMHRLPSYWSFHRLTDTAIFFFTFFILKLKKKKFNSIKFPAQVITLMIIYYYYYFTIITHKKRGGNNQVCDVWMGSHALTGRDAIVTSRPSSTLIGRPLMPWSISKPHTPFLYSISSWICCHLHWIWSMERLWWEERAKFNSPIRRMGRLGPLSAVDGGIPLEFRHSEQWTRRNRRLGIQWSIVGHSNCHRRRVISDRRSASLLTPVILLRAGYI